MPRTSRRTFLKSGVATLGGLAFGSSRVAGAPEDRYLIRPKRNGNLSGVEVLEELPGIDYVAVRGREKAVKRVARQYAPDVRLELDDPLEVAAPTSESATDEPGYGFQWDKQDLDIPTAHETSRGEGVRVAIIDSGVDATHPDLEHAVDESLGRNFSGDGYGANRPYGGFHGTHVAGIVAANDRNESGVVGTAPGAEIFDCRVFPYEEGAPFSVVLAAVLYSVEKDADVSNLSLGAYAPRSGYADRWGRFYGKALNASMTYANEEGTLLVLSAGNSGADLQHDKNYISLPNEGAQGMSIAATGPIGFGWDASEYGEEPAHSPAFYTNYGTNAIDLAAPGGDASLEAIDDGVPTWYYDLVYNTYSEANYEDGEYQGSTTTYSWVAGTSMAAPQVTGAAALVKAENPDYNPGQVESTLERAADVPEDYDKAYYGSGYLNVVDAL